VQLFIYLGVFTKPLPGLDVIVAVVDVKGAKFIWKKII